VPAAGPVEESRSLQTRVRTATARAGIAVEGLLDDDFWPHVSLCYLNGRTDPELLRTVVEGAPDTATEVVTDQLTQAVVTRADGHYRWQARARIYLAPQEPQSIPACRGSTWWRAREHGRPHPG
jgi:2'-5' RNA ligase